MVDSYSQGVKTNREMLNWPNVILNWPFWYCFPYLLCGPCSPFQINFIETWAIFLTPRPFSSVVENIDFLMHVNSEYLILFLYILCSIDTPIPGLLCHVCKSSDIFVIFHTFH